jgi:hypothetical protein
MSNNRENQLMTPSSSVIRSSMPSEGTEENLVPVEPVAFAWNQRQRVKGCEETQAVPDTRASRQTELQETFPTHVVCKWMGNSPKVAQRHYLQTTEEHFKKATQQASVSGRSASPCPEKCSSPANSLAENSGGGTRTYGKPSRLQPLSENRRSGMRSTFKPKRSIMARIATSDRTLCQHPGSSPFIDPASG